MAATKFVLAFAICRLIVTVGLTVVPVELLRLGIEGRMSMEAPDVEKASGDFGMLTREEPMAVMDPGSAEDVARLVEAAYESAQGFAMSARGHGHSINGQAHARKGVVIEMSRRKREMRVGKKGRYVDVWGGELWIEVLKATLQHGLAPKSWTDYLYLSVGGTLSNAGISGQTFIHGPQISNVYDLDVVTGQLSFPRLTFSRFTVILPHQYVSLSKNYIYMVRCTDCTAIL